MLSTFAFAQGPSITVNNNLFNCQIEVTLYQMDTGTMDCTSLTTISFGLGVSSSQTVSPDPGYVFVRAYVQKGGGTPACFNALVEPNSSPCDVGTIPSGTSFPQCCPSSLSGTTYVGWTGGMGAPVLTITN